MVNADEYCRYKKEIFTFADLIKWINERPDCIAFFNHPGDYDKKRTEFSHFNTIPSDHFVGMEQWNKKIPFKKYYYNDGYDKGDNRNYYEKANAKGWIIGTSGSGDDHNSTWGTAQPYRMAILSKKLTRAALLDAMKQRRFYSTLDKNLALSFKINGAEMGSVFKKEGTYKVQIKVSDSDKESFTEVLLIDKDHKTVFSGNPNKPDVCISTTLQTHNGDFFYVKVKQADGDEAISSPIYIVK